MNFESHTFVKTIRIHNFKSYKKTHEAGPCHPKLNTIIGPNGTGKSNFLDAILFVLGKRSGQIRFKRLIEIIYFNNLTRKQDASVTLAFKEYYKKIFEKVSISRDICVSKQIFKNNFFRYHFNGKETSYFFIDQIIENIGISTKTDSFFVQQGEIEKISLMKPVGNFYTEVGLIEYTENSFGSSRYSKNLNKNKKIIYSINNQAIYKKNLEKKKISIIASGEGRKKIFLSKRFFSSLTRVSSLNHFYMIQILSLEIKKKTKIFPHKLFYRNLLGITSKFFFDRRATVKTLMNLEYCHLIFNEFRYYLKGSFQLLKQKDLFFKQQIEFLVNTKPFLLMYDTPLFFSKSQKKRIYLIKKEIKQISFSSKAIFSLRLSLKATKNSFKAFFELFLNSVFFFFSKILEVLIKFEIKTQVISFFYDFFFIQQKKFTCAANTFMFRKEKASSKLNLKRLIKNIEFTLGLQMRKIRKSNLSLIRSKTYFSIESRNFLKEPCFLNERNFQEEKKNIKLNYLKINVPGIIDDIGSIAFLKCFWASAFFSILSEFINNVIINTVSQSIDAIKFLKSNNIGRTKFVILDKFESFGSCCKKGINKHNRFLMNKLYCRTKFKKLFVHVLGDTLIVKNIDDNTIDEFENLKKNKVIAINGIFLEKSGLISGGGAPSNNRFFGENRKIKNVNWIKNFEHTGVQPKNYNCFFLHKFLKKLSVSRLFSKISFYLSIGNDFLFFFFIIVVCIENPIKKRNKKKNHFLEYFERKIAESHLKKIKATEHKNFGLKLSVKNIFYSLCQFFFARFFLSKMKEVQPVCDELFFKKSFHSKEICLALSILQDLLNKIETKETSNDLEKFKIDRLLLGKFFNFSESNIEFIFLFFYSIYRIRFFFSRIIMDIKKKSYSHREKTRKTIKVKFFVKKKLLFFKKKNMRIKSELKKYFFFSREAKKHSCFFFFRSDKNFFRNHLSPLWKKIYSTIWCRKKMIKCIFWRFTCFNYSPNKAEIDFINFHYSLKMCKYIDGIRSRLTDTFNSFYQKKLIEEKSLSVHSQRLFEYVRDFLNFNNNIKYIFPKFSPGGGIELNLINSLDPFREGIVLSVKPAGKTWKTIIYLSGGEKTISSLSVIFSIQESILTSWYLMDEIDAALDYKNVSKIALYLHRHSLHFQILMISHRNNMFIQTDHVIGIYKLSGGTRILSLRNQN